MSEAALKTALLADAAALGFAAVGVATPDSIAPARARLVAFLDAGHHGTMAWLADTAERRADPRALWPEVRSIVVLGFNYGPDEDPLAALAERSSGAISVYARHRDYHDVVKGKVKELAAKLKARARRDFAAAAPSDAAPPEVKVFVDTAPVMEKPLAASAGLGWQGKHTNLVSRAHGSWLFLAEIFTTVALAPDPAETDRCGSCRACLDICPTAAFPAPYRLDARRCISYLTIEHDGPIPREFRAAIGNRIYGCDDCLAVCPWNKFAATAAETKLRARADLRRPRLADLAGLDDAGFRALFSASPVKRIGRDRFVRNVLIAIGNSGAPGLADSAEALLGDAAPQVRATAVWALARLATAERFAAQRAQRAGGEADESVRLEWRLGAGDPAGSGTAGS